MTASAPLVRGVDDDEADRYWDAVARSDSAAAMTVAQGCLDRGLRAADVLDGLVVPVQRRVGELWATASWTVAQEHAATAVSEFVVRTLHREVAHRLPAEDAARPSSALVVACAEKEWHALPALVLATALVDAGHRVVHLGADVSTRTLQGELLDTPARAVLVSASLSSSLLHVRRHVETATETGTPIVVGGRAFDAAGARARAVGATAQADSASELTALLVDLPAHVPPAAPLSHGAADEAAMIAARQGAVARAVLARLEDVSARVDAASWRVLSDQLPTIVGSLVSALMVEDASIVTDAWGWLAEVLTARGTAGDVVESVRAALVEELREFPAALTVLHAV